MASVNAYINFNGNCGQAFDFYKSVFGGGFQAKMKFADMPGTEAMSAEEKNRVMHVALPIGKNTVLMGSDWPSHLGAMVRGNSFSVAIAAESQAEADSLFQGLSADGQVTMPMSDAPWGAYFGMFTDKFGIQWLVNFDKKAG
jgi:PhnB protein